MPVSFVRKTNYTNSSDVDFVGAPTDHPLDADDFAIRIENGVGDVVDAYNAHEAETTTAHGGLVATTDARLSDPRTPADNSVSTAKLQDDAVTAAKIAANAVGASELADGAVDTAAVANLAITAAKMADATITAAKIAADTITGAQIAAAAIGASELADGSVDTAALQDDSVTAAKIAADAVGASEIAAGAVGTAELAADAVTSAQILAGTIVGADLANDTITATQIAPNAVGASELADGAVDTAAIATGAVTSASILDGTIVAGDIAAAIKDPAAGVQGLRSLGATATQAAQGDLVVYKTLVTAKGDLFGASASGVPARVPVGADGTVLIADSTQAAGVRWGAPFAVVDAKGDLIVGSAADTVGRLGAGADGQVLTADATQTLGVRWATPTGGGGGSGAGLLATGLKTANYALQPSDFAPADTTAGPITYTLPNAPADGTVVGGKLITKGGTNALTFQRAGTDVIDKAGTNSIVLSIVGQAIVLLYRAGIWYIINDAQPIAGLDTRYILDTLVTAKGDIIVATAAGVPSVLGAGVNGQVLVSDTSTATGLRWVNPVHPTIHLSLNGASQATFTPTANALSTTPSGCSGFYGRADATGYIQAQLGIMISLASTVAGTKLRPQYSTNRGASWSYFEAAGLGLEIDATVSQSANAVVLLTGWITMVIGVGGADAEIDVRLAAYNTGATPANIGVRQCELMFR